MIKIIDVSLKSFHPRTFSCFFRHPRVHGDAGIAPCHDDDAESVPPRKGEPRGLVDSNWLFFYASLCWMERWSGVFKKMYISANNFPKVRGWAPTSEIFANSLFLTSILYTIETYRKTGSTRFDLRIYRICQVEEPRQLPKKEVPILWPLVLPFFKIKFTVFQMKI